MCATVPEHLCAIIVRVEDDVAVTAGGCKNLSAASCPQGDAVETWIAKLTQQQNAWPA